ncbi:methionine gamma-lyase family protein [Selenomonadales bacterium OttesenSCG-928-I06]|nr:methionine gamma-lyase family protein [Selenomonadales bacterium OttesenSCG-928-I06]
MVYLSKELLQLSDIALKQVEDSFQKIEQISEKNTLKVIEAFRDCRVSEYHFKETTGYGYDNIGKDKIGEVFSKICKAEKAIFSQQFVSGTHALSCVLFGILRPGDTLLSVTGTPYDTMQTVIGKNKHVDGSLTDWKIGYEEIPMTENGVDIDKLEEKINTKTKMILIQRSRGYSLRKPLSTEEIKTICTKAHEIKPDIICFVDNCYGEFVEIIEPIEVGADIIAGSLIKNPGGGIAPSGGYIAGKQELVELASYRLTAPGLGDHLGATANGNRLLFQGLFLAPHVVSQALKSAVFTAALFKLLGYETVPDFSQSRQDIIQAIKFNSSEKMIKFCQQLQNYSPIDSNVKPIPADMPGYKDKIIMASGSFIQGSSIEISADGPLRDPYIAYLQGGLTFEHSKLAILNAAQAIMEK